MGIYKDLKNKRVVITGGADGIGFATAQRFIDEGSRVVIFDLDKKKSETLAAKLPGLKGTVIVDVSDPDQVRDKALPVHQNRGPGCHISGNQGGVYRHSCARRSNWSIHSQKT